MLYAVSAQQEGVKWLLSVAEIQRAKVQSLVLVLNLTLALPVLTSRSLSHQLSVKGNSLCPLYSVPFDPYHISEAATAGSVWDDWLILYQLDTSQSPFRKSNVTWEMVSPDWLEASRWCLFMTEYWRGRTQSLGGGTTPWLVVQSAIRKRTE